MYLPEHFRETRVDELHRLIQAHPLGTLVHASGGALDADHIPFELLPEEGAHGLLRAHVARANPLWQHADGSEVLVVFRGAEHYISPNWYPSKHRTHEQVPTWNYQVVHVRGTLRVIDEERFVRGLVGRLTRTHEADEARPWRMSDSTPEFIAGMLAKIVGIEVEIQDIVGKSKLSQNKQAEDAAGTATRLGELGAAELAGAMRDHLPS
ncbi:FMN-binding negative transcriptional regulator [Pseudomonas citronellolis]|uniref:FMN-binding negative transcriptional regulator n=1 Tax=Pseudomonas citronellolis TaxID=53408 RepID=UPI0023E36881|nr:FMN-binding negative transcriptional regulator [Pseudomonas citronellolis]MDF3931324.1 FMN-binding negative transcriptional regulator [Pseudomonas citronellolis]